MIYILRNLNEVLEQTELRQVYLALVKSLISYGIIDWGGKMLYVSCKYVKIKFLEYWLIKNECIQRKMCIKN